VLQATEISTIHIRKVLKIAKFFLPKFIIALCLDYFFTLLIATKL